MPRPLFVWVARATLLVCALSPVAFGAEPAMRAHFINVGQADSILLEFPCGAALIDAGVQDDTYRERLLGYLREFFDRRPDLDGTLGVLFVTHSDPDHTNALQAVVSNFKVKNYVDNGIVAGSGRAGPKWLRDNASERGITVKGVPNSQITSLGHKRGLTDDTIDPFKCPQCDPQITVLSGGHETYDNLNNESLVIRVDFGNSSFLFPGDLEEEGIAPLVEHYQGTGRLDTDVLKVGHHGSYNATTEDLLNAVTPNLAVILVGPWDFGLRSRGIINTYHFGHPRIDAVNLLCDAISARRSQPVAVMVAEKPKVFHPYTVSKRLYATAWDGDIVVRANLAGQYKTTTRGVPSPGDHATQPPGLVKARGEGGYALAAAASPKRNDTPEPAASNASAEKLASSAAVVPQGSHKAPAVASVVQRRDDASADREKGTTKQRDTTLSVRGVVLCVAGIFTLAIGVLLWKLIKGGSAPVVDVSTGQNEAKELLFHTEKVFHDRLAVFVVAEALLFAAINSRWGDTPIALLIAGMGLLFTAAMWISVARSDRAASFYSTLYQRESPLYSAEYHLGHRLFLAIRHRCESYWLMSWVMPGFTFFVWSVFFTRLLLGGGDVSGGPDTSGLTTAGFSGGSGF